MIYIFIFICFVEIIKYLSTDSNAILYLVLITAREYLITAMTAFVIMPDIGLPTLLRTCLILPYLSSPRVLYLISNPSHIFIPMKEFLQQWPQSLVILAKFKAPAVKEVQ